MKNNKKSFLIIIIITAIILYFALKDNFAEKIQYLFSFDIKWLIAAFALILAYWFLKGLVLYYCTSKVKKEYTEKQGITLMITTQFFHAITPFAAGGQPWQIYKLKKDGLTLGEIYQHRHPRFHCLSNRPCFFRWHRHHFKLHISYLSKRLTPKKTSYHRFYHKHIRSHNSISCCFQ